MNNQSALGIIFRVPEYGKVKKRLALQIGADRALKIYTTMLFKTIENVSKLKDINIYGFYDGNVSALPDILNKFPLIPQKGDDLGERMFNAIKFLFEKGYKKAALIGSDSPDLPVSYVEDAFLQLNAHEVLIGPTIDGGYYLIGMKTPLDKIFKGIIWGSSSVLKDTISIANKEGIKYFLLPEWYDIDDVEGLKRWENKQLSDLSRP